jgi:hypothetical protein
MKTAADFRFSASWQLAALGLRPGDRIVPSGNLGDLRACVPVDFVGFDDVDNHFGIFVFTGPKGELLEVRGDFSSPGHPCFLALKRALARRD